jgi:hypothetical protein
MTVPCPSGNSRFRCHVRRCPCAVLRRAAERVPHEDTVAGRGDPCRARPYRRTAAELQRLRLRRRRTGAGRCAGVRAALDGRRSDRAGRRTADHGEGSAAVPRLAHPAWFADHRCDRALAGRQCVGGPPARTGRSLPRQDDDARVRLEGRHRQSADRHHPQPVEPDAHARRQQRWRCGGRGLRHGRAASGHRRRRLDPHSGGDVRTVRLQAHLRCGAGTPAFAGADLVASGADRAHRGRCSPDAERDFGTRPARLPCRAVVGHRLSGGAR